MNEQQRSELERLKQRHARLEQELASFATEIRSLERLLRSTESQTPPAEPLRTEQQVPRPQEGAAPVPIPRIPAPPVIAHSPAATQQVPTAPTSRPPLSEPHKLRLRAEPEQPKMLRGACRACGGHLEFPLGAMGDTVLCPHCGSSTLLTTTPGAIPVPPPISGTVPTVRTQGPKQASSTLTPPPAKSGSFEMRLGTYWLVRIGIVMVLTALVFFGNLAYHNFISKLGPGGKVALLYIASAGLLAAGAWWQRKTAKESLKNYAQVLFAGGLAGVYFTTYAAYYNDHLKIIQDRTVDGLLLLGWAGFMAWIADRRKSEVLALFAIGLAYYTSIITRVGYFTLYSNLVLTGAAVFFLVRNRWAALSLGSLFATYAAYAFWRFFNGSEWHWASPEAGLWTGTYFLLSYWLLFTAAVFLSKHEKLSGENRAGFLTLNNGAFFAGFVLTMLQVQTGGFWKFCLIYGSALLALAALARWLLAAEPLAKNTYLTQGLVLVTVGFIAKYAGMKLALILGVESVILLVSGQQLKNRVLLAGAYIAAILAVGWGIDGMRQFDRQGLWLGIGLGALMLVNMVLVHRACRSEAVMRPQPGYFAALALLIGLVAAWDNATQTTLPLVLAVAAVPLTLSFYVLRVRELTLLSQAYLLLAQAAWVFNALDGRPVPAWWNPALMIAISLGLSHWWQSQKVLRVSANIGSLWQGLYALAIVCVLYRWLQPADNLPAWLAWTSLLAVVITAYGVFTRAWLLALSGQIFMGVSAVLFVMQLAAGKPHWPLALAPIGALLFLSFSTVRWFERKPDDTGRVSDPLLHAAFIYRWVALFMSIWWVCRYIPERERIWLLALLGLWVFVWAGWQRNREALFYSAVYTAAALALFWLPLLQASAVYWPNLLVILILLAQRQFARRLPERYPLGPEVHGAIIVIGGLSLWRFLSLWVLEQQPSGFYLTASWSLLALALFTAGISLRERMYRWLGLGILGCALGRVMIIDVWKLETLYRILSFLALGVVLLVLGFIYNKYQEKIREWL
jgi:hypothetical protein